MAKKQSAGILVYRRTNGGVEVLLGHPGGPFWAKKDKGAWSIPKGETEDAENRLEAAKREFKEEMGHNPPDGEYIYLESIERPGKVIYVWAVEGDLDASKIVSNKFEMEWPPRSGQKQEFVEVDRAAWFPIQKAGVKMHKGQDTFIERLAENLRIDLATNEQSKSSQTSLF